MSEVERGTDPDLVSDPVDHRDHPSRSLSDGIDWKERAAWAAVFVLLFAGIVLAGYWVGAQQHDTVIVCVDDGRTVVACDP